MYSLTDETFEHFSNLVEELCPKFTNPWRATCCCSINAVDCCLHKCVELDQGLIIGQVENVVRFKQFIKSTQGAGGLAGDKVLVHDNVELMDVVLGAAHSKDVWLLSLSFPQVFINAAV